MKFHFISSNTSEAISAKEKYINSYHQADPSIADVIIPIGGDGILLKSLHDFNELNKPFFGINFGSVGFLMNSISNKNLEELIKNSGLNYCIMRFGIVYGKRGESNPSAVENLYQNIKKKWARKKVTPKMLAGIFDIKIGFSEFDVKFGVT